MSARLHRSGISLVRVYRGYVPLTVRRLLEIAHVHAAAGPKDWIAGAVSLGAPLHLLG
jgi:hypothetical protein